MFHINILASDVSKTMKERTMENDIDEKTKRLGVKLGF